MTNMFILTLITIAIGFSLSFAGFYLYFIKAPMLNSASLKNELAFSPVYSSLLFLLTLLCFIVPTKGDFISDFQPTELLIPLICAGVCYALSLFKTTAKFLNLALILSVGISTFFLPSDFLIFKGSVPFWADRLFLIIIWSVFACFYHILNGVNGILPIFNASYAFVLIVLSLLNAAPALYGFIGLGLLTVNTSFMIYNWFPAKITLTDNSCKIFGFILGGVMIFGCSENLAPCFSIILTIFVLELFQSIFKKLTLRNKYNNLAANTIYYQAHIRGLSPEQVCLAVFKIQTLFIILSCFQAYLPNDYSLPIASIFLAAWFLNKLHTWDEPKQSLKEINQEFVNDLRQNINEIKDSIKRD